jgi:thiol-disulfide isomerase/thioredoxin
MRYALNMILLITAITYISFAQPTKSIAEHTDVSSKVFISFTLKAKEWSILTYANLFFDNQDLEFNNPSNHDTLITKSIYTRSPLSFSCQLLSVNKNESIINYVFIASPGDTLHLSRNPKLYLNVSQCKRTNVIADGTNPYYIDGGFLPLDSKNITLDDAWPLFLQYFSNKYDNEIERVNEIFPSPNTDSISQKQFILNCKIHYYKRLFNWVWQKNGTYYKPAIDLLGTKLPEIEKLLNDEHIFLTPELLNIIDGMVRLKIIQKGKDFKSGSNVYNEAASANIGVFKKAYLAVCVIKNPVKKGMTFDRTLRDYKNRYKSDQMYLTHIDSILKERNKIVFIPGKGKLAKLNGPSVILENIIKDKKYTFIDFWASWCVPCRQQLPYLDSMKNQMKGYPINFISVNLDEKDSNWKIASKAEAKYLKSNNFYLLNEKKAMFVNALNISSIPRYIVLQGTKIIAMDFYQPSEPAFKKELIELMKSNNFIR